MQKKQIILIVTIVAAALIIFVVRQSWFDTSYEKELTEIANQLNANCPVMIDADTRLDSANVLPDNTLQYNYTMVRVLKDSINIQDFRSNLEDILLNAVKTNPELKPYREHKVTLMYHYKDKTGSLVTKITLSPEQYGK